MQPHDRQGERLHRSYPTVAGCAGIGAATAPATVAAELRGEIGPVAAFKLSPS